jgi:hypothetical protein
MNTVKRPKKVLDKNVNLWTFQTFDSLIIRELVIRLGLNMFE